MTEHELRHRLLGITAYANEYCNTLEGAAEAEREEFIASMLKLLPKLYLEFADTPADADPHGHRRHHHDHGNCGDDCHCGDDCGCGDDCHCGDDCGCGDDCHCGDDCGCEEGFDGGEISLEEEADGNDIYFQEYVDEDFYDSIRRHVEALLGPDDVFLETFEDDMKYSDTPIAASISECLADIFQPLYNFVSVVKDSEGAYLMEAYKVCRENFTSYWSQTLCNVLRALNHLYYN